MCTICETPIRPNQPYRRHAADAYTHNTCRRPPTTVPYIATWSGEKAAPDPVVVYRMPAGDTFRRGKPGITCMPVGIRYSGEALSDRDEHGVLWLPDVDNPGTGRLLYGNVHPGRQRRAMTELLCQVCGGPADRDSRGVLWLVEDGRGDWSGWPKDLMTTHPPICLKCVRAAREQCPHLWKGSALVRVGRSVVCGVWGRRYTAGRLGPLVVESTVVPFESPLIHWTVASQLVRALYACTVVSVDEELAALT
ncbi:hypothetical protein GCM10010389_51470 [Streptomyces echinoruber]|uniref:Uncharacterized protein n=1 Tax=Streptomyces echinoruber TaxID=68898 RepID=A0A918RQS1_9ACTN|nr:hypothetical protein GCM10010389_51470 [Streptomyces echinoruber]